MTLGRSSTALVLAAGRSRRMGAFKPLLPFGPTTVIETTVAHLLRAGLGEVVVVLGHRAAEVRRQLASLPVKYALNESPESEMTASLARGVEAASPAAAGFLIALADQPAVDAETIERILSLGAREGAKLLIPTWQGRGGHPVFIDAAYREELLRLDPQVGLRGLFAAHRAEVSRCEAGSPFVVRDLDTWEDYRALHLEIFGSPPPANAPG